MAISKSWLLKGMGKKFNKIFGCIAFSILLCGANAQPVPADVQISENLKLHVIYFCLPQLMVRSTLNGHDILAARYVDSLFNSFNLSGLPNFENLTYSQPFKIYNTISEQQFLVVNDSTYLFPDDFAYLGRRP